MKNVNINTIAKEAGVSRTTVSRVINCKYSCRMRNPEREGLKDLKRLEMA